MIVRALSFVLLIVEVVLLTLLALRQARGETLPIDDVLRDRCDVMERNHFYDEHGRLVFEQIIFIDVNANMEEEVVAWRLVKSDAQIPQREWAAGDYVARWTDAVTHGTTDHRGYIIRWTDGERFREVRSRFFRESWTQYDPELLAREKLPKDKRRELRGVR